MLLYVHIDLLCFFFIVEEIRRGKKKSMGTKEENILVNRCRYGIWEDAKTMVVKNPQLMCKATDENGYTPATWAAYDDNVEFLQCTADAICFYCLQRQTEKKEQRRKMLRAVFEEDNDGWTPAHSAAYRGHTNAFVFLVEHSPSGAAILEVKDMHGSTPVCEAALNGHADVLGISLRNGAGGFLNALLASDGHSNLVLLSASSSSISDRKEKREKMALSP
jgi:hypothetical protein